MQHFILPRHLLKVALMIGNANHFSNIEQINFEKDRWNLGQRL
jgi:hypothetical protein